MTHLDTLFEWVDGVAYFRGLPVERRTVTVAGRAIEIVGLKDAADLLDLPEFAKRFLEDDRAPYGVELWPAALMLAEHILNGDDGAGTRAIEIGCGLGIVSMAAAMKGWRVEATDCDPTALHFAEYNAANNRVDIEAFECLDWHDPPAGERFDRVFGADVLYELKDHVPVVECVDCLLTADGVALLADPNRGVADRFAPLVRDHGFDVQVVPASETNIRGQPVNGRIFKLCRAAKT
ncbi:MAG: 50S ribosomal protein L11 methyltransferase [Phycisphaerales bacterium]|nr:MAG: 50S ribosomal protein L11 methyltransferase [Phycisphaerales bacterium]